MTLRQRLCCHRGKLFSNKSGVHTWLCLKCGHEWPRELDTALRPERDRAAKAATEAWWLNAELKALERMANR